MNDCDLAGGEKYFFYVIVIKRLQENILGGNMADDIGRQLLALEKRMDAFIRDQNKVNQKTYDNVMRRLNDQNKVNQKAHDHISKMEKRFEAYIKDQNKANKNAFNSVEKTIVAQNKVNLKAHNHIAQLEKRFAKLEKKR